MMALDLKLFSDKLKKYREQLQMSLNDVLVGTGINEARFRKLEFGEIEPSGDEILILSDFFKCDYKFFISNERNTSFEQTEKLYRKFGTDFNSADRVAIQEFIFLCECESFVLKNLSDTKFIPFEFIKTGSNHKQHGINAAKSLRRHLNYETNQIPSDIYYDFRKLGTHIFRRKLQNSNISGLFIKHSEAGKCVLVNYDEDIFRQRFTVAHEIAHSILDVEDDVTVSFNNKYNDYVEIRANAFASNFLVPPETIKSMNLNRNNLNENIIISLAIKFQVNIQPLVYSLKEQGVITEDEVSKYVKLRIPREAKIDQELSSDLPPRIYEARHQLFLRGLSYIYVKNCYEAYLRNIISAGRLAEMLLSNENDLVDILTLYNLKLVYEH